MKLLSFQLYDFLSIFVVIFDLFSKCRVCLINNIHNLKKDDGQRCNRQNLVAQADEVFQQFYYITRQCHGPAGHLQDNEPEPVVTTPNPGPPGYCNANPETNSGTI